MILTTGATGTVGREVVAQLLAAGQKVRALTRDPARARFDGRVEVVKGDLDQPETIVRAVEGAERLFSLVTGPQGPVQEAALALAAKKAGVRQIVKLSVLGVDQGQGNAIARWHEAGERAVRESGIAWTFVRPGSFMSNALFWVGTIRSQGKVFAPYGEGKFSPVHPRDIAAVAVKALTTPGHEGKVYPLTGPQALGMAEQVRILADAVGRPIEYVPISDEAARQGMTKAGLTEPLVGALLQVAAYIRSGQAGNVLPTVEQVTFRKALTFADWAREHAQAFR